MKTIVLAAGQGMRLKPLTDNIPKCMVEYEGKPIIDYIVQTNRECGIKDIVLACGYKMDNLISHFALDKCIKFYANPRYDTTNMVYTLFCAGQELNDKDDTIISYSDIIYSSEVLKNLINDDAQISVIVDRRWRWLWEIRMDDPLTDVETMRINSNDNIIELGKKPKSYEEVEGQYIGLIKISKQVMSKIKEFYLSLDMNAIYDGKNFENMYMTSFLQLIIDRLMMVRAVSIDGGWLEIDSIQDLLRYKKQNIQL